MEEPNDLGAIVVDLESSLAALRRDHSKLASRIRTLEHSVTCECEAVTLRLHFPSLRQGVPTIAELVDAIAHFLPQFSLPRSDIAALDRLYGKIDVHEFRLKVLQMGARARALFMQANRATNRNGEAGELLLYLLTEWVLAAPQVIAKMSLKTNRNMPVHGADGVHVRYCSSTARLIFYWGESKLYADVGDAIVAAVRAMSEALAPEKIEHELELVQRHIDFSGLDDASKQAFLRYLDPFEEESNARHDVMTCLVGFNFDAFGGSPPTGEPEAEEKFKEQVRAKLQDLVAGLVKELKSAHLASRPIEVFFFPVPSVKELRDLFQAKIGWS